MANPVEVAFFDTHVPEDDPGFDGAWSAYPYFDSGIVLVNSRREGFFVLQPTAAAVATEPVELPASTVLSAPFPNPFHDRTTFRLTLPAPEWTTVAVYDLLGRRVALLHEGFLPSGTPQSFTFDPAALPSGTYLLRATAETFSAVRPVTFVK